jgi:acyl carrier protein
MQSELYKQLLSILSEILQVDIDANTGAVSRREMSEWDSMSHLRFALELEEIFEITISDEDWVDVMSLGDVEALLGREGISHSVRMDP